MASRIVKQQILSSLSSTGCYTPTAATVPMKLQRSNTIIRSIILRNQQQRYYGSGASSSSSSSSRSSIARSSTQPAVKDDDDPYDTNYHNVSALSSSSATTTTTTSSSSSGSRHWNAITDSATRTKNETQQQQQQKQQQPRKRFHREPVRYIPAPTDGKLKYVPDSIQKPSYALNNGIVPYSKLTEEILLHTPESAQRMKDAAQLAADVLQLACTIAKPGISTDEIDTVIHEAIINANAYPSPLNYSQFPKSVCTSINEIICHGIPDGRILQMGDVVSFDVSCYYNNVHGDNCATIIVGDNNNIDNSTNINVNSNNNNNLTNVDWRGIPYKTNFDSIEEEEHFRLARNLIHATRESLYAGINACYPGGCLSNVGNAIEQIANQYGYSSVRKYRGHGISHIFHTAPFVKHYSNTDYCTLYPGMIFTIEPMFVTSKTDDCFEWESDNWTVQANDSTALAAQFEHTIYITEHDVEILTLPTNQRI